MSTKWTPGPWHWKPTGEVADKWGAVYAGTECICGGMLRADARLIAAAPDLYAALEALIKAVATTDEVSVYELVGGRAALALARGEK